MATVFFVVADVDSVGFSATYIRFRDTMSVVFHVARVFGHDNRADIRQNDGRAFNFTADHIFDFIYVIAKDRTKIFYTDNAESEIFQG